MAPCQVHPIRIHTNSNSSTTVNARTRPVRPIGGVRRNLFGQPDRLEMAQNFDIENARQLERLEKYKIIAPAAPPSSEASEERPLPVLIAKELEKAQENDKLMEKNKNSDVQHDNVATVSEDDDHVSATKRQELIEKTPTLSTKTKLRTLHTNRATIINVQSNNDDARYRPYNKQLLITDVLPKRKSVPPPS
ncbi:uncharacterized protein LOC101462587 [Ceratitis capitata]|uniref:uncharacterized protein LOC101462587 n=1 Tax=Ceratitis capitata TaxID=7213 RepID=UPI00032A27A2|nr:uncharacterized protein LOC101462587 [Ceratitis capitata]